MTSDPASLLSSRVRTDLIAAMAARRTDEIGLLRSLLAAIDNAQAVPRAEVDQRWEPRPFGNGDVEVPRVRLSGANLETLVENEMEARQAAAAQMARLGQSGRAEKLHAEARLLARYRAT